MTTVGTFGGGATVTLTAKGTKVADVISDVGRLSRLVPKSAQAQLGESLKPIVSIIRQSSPGFKSGLNAISKSDGNLGKEYAKAYVKYSKGGHTQQAKYIEKLVGAPKHTPTPELLNTAVSKHLDISQRIDSVVPKKFEDQVTRGIRKQIDLGGGKKINTKSEDVFSIHPSQKTADHRYSIGGPEGNSALYATIGKDSKTLDLIKSETKVGSLNELHLETRVIPLERVLDLTDSEVLRKLNINAGDLIEDSYLQTQVIGDVARSKGFQGIIFPSAQGSGINLMWFN